MNNLRVSATSEVPTPRFSMENLRDLGVSGADMGDRQQIVNDFAKLISQHVPPALVDMPERTGLGPAPQEDAIAQPPAVHICYLSGSTAVGQIVVVGRRRDSHMVTVNRYWESSTGIMTELLQVTHGRFSSDGQALLVETPESRNQSVRRLATPEDIRRLGSLLSKTEWPKTLAVGQRRV